MASYGKLVSPRSRPVSAATPPAPRTPAEQEGVDDFLDQARLDVLMETELIDCDDVAPAPEGERPS